MSAERMAPESGDPAAHYRTGQFAGRRLFASAAGRAQYLLLTYDNATEVAP
jgi:hypothetical protein